MEFIFMKKFIFFRDAVLTTLFILGFIGLASLIPFGDVVNPVSKMLGDFKLTDIVFSKLRETKDGDNRITLVNIGGSRAEIAKQIEIINQYHPKVIGIDAFFRAPKDRESDSALVQAFSKVKNLVLVCELIDDPDKNVVAGIKLSHPMFMKYAHAGFADMISEGMNKFRTSRDCVPKDAYADSIVYSFPTQLAALYDKNAVSKYLERKKDTEIINFQGNVNASGAQNAKITFSAIEVNQVLNGEFDGEEVFKDKIVIMGFMGDENSENEYLDRFFTPLNDDYVGKALPDMYGVVVHANIVSMILKGDFINEMPEALNLFLSLVLIFLNVWLLTYSYHKLKDWYDGGSNIIVLVEVLILIWMVLLVFNNFNYKFDVSFAIIALFLSGNLIEIYQGLLKKIFEAMVNKIKRPAKKIVSSNQSQPVN